MKCGSDDQPIMHFWNACHNQCLLEDIPVERVDLNAWIGLHIT